MPRGRSLMGMFWHRVHFRRMSSSLVVLVDVEDVSEGVRLRGGVWVGDAMELSEVCCELLL